MAALLNVEIEGLAQVMQYEDDSVEAWYTDGARIVLKACAAAFTRQGHAENELLYPSSKAGTVVHQFTAYAAQRWRDRVRQLVTFRNYFAERPFLARSLINTELQVRVPYASYLIVLGGFFLHLLHSRHLTVCCSMQHGQLTWIWLLAVI